MQLPLNLSVGKLICRPNRFVFEGIVGENAQRWHCPVTGSIGLIDDFYGLPCLFTPAANSEHRSTQGTVEAISIKRNTFDWIGINQNRINGWVENFLQKNALSEMIDTNGCRVRHEVKVDNSRIDIVVDGKENCTFLELKTPTRDLLLTPEARFTRPPSDTYFDRGLRHFEILAELAKAGHRAIVALCFMYDAPLFPSPVRDKWNAKIIDTIAEATACGVENWQINFRISPTSLEITKCAKLPDRTV
jgi:sugar fermentation stimulation protein A